MYTEIATYIINKTIADSTDVQYVVYFDELEKEYGIEMTQETVDFITDELWDREELADLELPGDGFDVVIYSDYREG